MPLLSLKEGPLRPYLELTRPPALCTAPADALTGLAWSAGLWACLHASTPTLRSQGACLTLSPWVNRELSAQLSHGYPLTPMLLCALCSVLIYAAGMICNDLFDLEVDRAERPARPLPSGRASLSVAWCSALTLQLGALGVAAQLSELSVYAALFTIGCTYLYNALLKSRALLGPLSMASCRVGNGLIGASALVSALPEQPLKWALSGSLPWLLGGTGLYVAALTWLSRYEVEGGAQAKRVSKLLWGLSLTPLLWLGVGWLSWGALLCLWVAWRLWRAFSPLWAEQEPSARAVQGSMMSGIQGVALMNMALCAGLGAWSYALIIFGLGRLARRVGRWFYAT